MFIVWIPGWVGPSCTTVPLNEIRADGLCTNNFIHKNNCIHLMNMVLYLLNYLQMYFVNIFIS